MNNDIGLDAIGTAAVLRALQAVEGRLIGHGLLAQGTAVDADTTAASGVGCPASGPCPEKLGGHQHPGLLVALIFAAIFAVVLLRAITETRLEAPTGE